MPRKSKLAEKHWDDPEQSKRFLDSAKAAEASENPEDFDHALTKIARQKPTSRRAKPAAS
jgi:hypothetical protein